MSECKCSYFEHGQICVCGKFHAPGCGHGVECYDVCVHRPDPRFTEAKMRGTRYILQLDVYASKDVPDADITKIWDLLGDSFNIPHNLSILAQEDMKYEDKDD